MAIQKNSRVKVIEGPNHGKVGHVEFLYKVNGNLIASIMTSEGFPIAVDLRRLKEAA